MVLTLLVSVMLGMVALPDLARAAQFTNPAGGYTLSYPDGWNVTRIERYERAVEITNPTYRSVQGEVVPPGGAEIIVSVFPPYTQYSSLFHRGP
jgi:hypothetical protein